MPTINKMSKDDYVKATVTIWFEKDHISCQYCPLLETYSRNYCRVDGGYIPDPKTMMSGFCPLKFEQEETNV